MERSAIYKPKEKDHAFHPQPECPQAVQWWYHDGVFSNGYCMDIIFFPLIAHKMQSMGRISFDVCGTDGKLIQMANHFHINEVIASTENLDVKIGNNYIRGTFPRYEIHYQDGDSGADLIYESITQDFIEPPDGVYFGREQFPSTPAYFGYVSRPRSIISGKLILNGKEIIVNGEGYAEHMWTNVGIEGFPRNYWAWGRIFLPEHTIVWWDTQTNETFGHRKVKWLWAFKGGELLDYSRNADIYVDLCDPGVDQELGIISPRKIVLIIDTPKIRGTATYSIKHVVKKIKKPNSSVEQDGWKGWSLYLSDCHSQFEIEGKTVETHTKELHDLAM